MVNQACPVCKSTMNSGYQSWHWKCVKCGYEKADFVPAINEEIAHYKIDENYRENGLRALRIDNFTRLLQLINSNGVTTGTVLDVGCAHGWFLEAAENNGFKVYGIEPDLNIFNSTVKRGYAIRRGYFPEVLEENEQFDVIVFNDVFEHIPDITLVLANCKKHLKPNGLLVLNLPSSSGLFYKVARVLLMLGIHSFFERLWQKGLPSPHLHYFNSSNLHLLVQSNGFEEVISGQLSTLHLKGLFTRISYIKDHIMPVRLLIYFCVILSLPLILMMPSDIIYSISKKSKNL